MSFRFAPRDLRPPSPFAHVVPWPSDVLNPFPVSRDAQARWHGFAVTDFNLYYKYLILQSNGFCIDVADRDPVELAGLLADGWKPVRETPFSASGHETSAILIVLRRETDLDDDDDELDEDLSHELDEDDIEF